MIAQAQFEILATRAREDATQEQNVQAVREKYAEMFTPGGISTLDADRFRTFLTYRENRHWIGINRHSGEISEDLPLLKRALSILIDESRPISDRIDEARRMVAGLGKAVISAILIVAHPEKYGVFNNRSRSGLRLIGRYPGDSIPGFGSLSTGKQYVQVNRVLNDLSKAHNLSLWALDTVLGHLGRVDVPASPNVVREDSDEGDDSLSDDISAGRFPLEKQLERFLVENWDSTDLANSLEILTDEDGEVSGSQYPTDVGPIDILCKNKDGSGYTVVELKKGQTSDQTVGQVTRYMGEVQRTLARDGDSVRGLIICGEADKKLMASLKALHDVGLYTYDLRLTLTKKG
jgi:hypothetical protein